MGLNVFDFNDYRDFMKQSLDQRGAKLGLATHLNCQSAYISRILAGQADLSLEQAISSCSYFQLVGAEEDYFVMLIHAEKAGTKDLKEYYKKKIGKLKNEYNQIASRLPERHKLTEAEENILFSSWLYNAFTMAVRIPELRTRKSLAQYFKLTTEQAQEIIQFLLGVGLLTESNGLLTSGAAFIHQDKESPNMKKSQANWRLHALHQMNLPSEDDFHFSGIYTLSKSASKEVRKIIIECIEKYDAVIRPSKDETLYSVCIDWFKV